MKHTFYFLPGHKGTWHRQTLFEISPSAQRVVSPVGISIHLWIPDWRWSLKKLLETVSLQLPCIIPTCKSHRNPIWRFPKIGLPLNHPFPPDGPFGGTPNWWKPSNPTWNFQNLGIDADPRSAFIVSVFVKGLLEAPRGWRVDISVPKLSQWVCKMY